jgi:hypothetical protein
MHLNRVGISDCGNRKMNGVIVPMAISGRAIHHGISRNVNDISAIGYRSAAGE